MWEKELPVKINLITGFMKLYVEVFKWDLSGTSCWIKVIINEFNENLQSDIKMSVHGSLEWLFYSVKYENDIMSEGPRGELEAAQTGHDDNA